MKPSTPLPWQFGHIGMEQSFWIAKDEKSVPAAIVEEHGGLDERKDAAYIVHACNSYPRLVEALRNSLTVCESSEDFGVRHGPGIAQARSILRELGEIK